MSDPYERYDQASAALEEYDRHIDTYPTFLASPQYSDELEQEKYDASQDVSSWHLFWNP